ncbi:MAG TPA: hypothetical protein PKN52_08520 [Trueperaceae bacterium]|nr:hypothetical protein [Trueperaceae bacterium]
MAAEQMLLADATDDGAIVLRPMGVYPIEIYNEDRVQEFLDEDTLPRALEELAAEHLSRRHGK